MMESQVDRELLEKIADLIGKPVGAFNIRKDTGCDGRQSTENIQITGKTDGKSGIDIRIKDGTKGEQCHIPVIITVIDEATDIGQRIASGASILNVAGGANTPAIVRKIRTEYPDFPIIATGGNKPDTIAATVAAGANAITFTPPSAQELFKAMMTRYRDE